MDGKILNRRWKVNANHALYRKTGDWYHKLTKFPGVLFDENGYVVFETKEEFLDCQFLIIKQDVNVPKGISAIPSYIKVKFGNDEIIPSSKLSLDISQENIHYEGTAKSVQLTRYERNTKVRNECLNHYGFKCFICNFNFEKRYGSVAKNIIHVHHLRLLSEINEKYIVDPIKDLRPVCPNCHAVIHSRRPPFGVSEVKNMLASGSE